MGFIFFAAPLAPICREKYEYFRRKKLPTVHDGGIVKEIPRSISAYKSVWQALTAPADETPQAPAGQVRIENEDAPPLEKRANRFGRCGVRKGMGRREDEQAALDIVAGRNNSTRKARKDKVSWIAILSIGLWVAAIAVIGMVAAYAYRQ